MTAEVNGNNSVIILKRVSSQERATYHIHGADAQVVVFDGFVIQAASRRHDDDARAGINGEDTVSVTIGNLEQQTRDGTALHLDNKRSARGVLEHVGCVFTL